VELVGGADVSEAEAEAEVIVTSKMSEHNRSGAMIFRSKSATTAAIVWAEMDFFEDREGSRRPIAVAFMPLEVERCHEEPKQE
jgi:hypothetical protein